MYYPTLQIRYKTLGDHGYLLDLRSGDILELAPPYAALWEQALEADGQAATAELEAFIELALAHGYLAEIQPVKDAPHIKLKTRSPACWRAWVALQRVFHAFQNQPFGQVYQVFAALEKPQFSTKNAAKAEKAFSRALWFSTKPTPLIRSFALYYTLIEAGVQADHVIGMAPGPLLLSWVEIDGVRQGDPGDFVELDRF